MRLFLLIIVSFFLHQFAIGQRYEWNEAKSKHLIETLAADSLQGRRAGSEFEEKALDFIDKEFKSTFGKKLKRQPFFAFPSNEDSIMCTNGYYFFNQKKKQTILISAHYEHIGLGGALSKAATKIEVHNGADDNASGVAAVFQTVSDLLNAKTEYNILVVFYSAHEIGLFGSKAFEEETKRKKYQSVFLHVNFDMVGRVDPSTHQLYFSCTDALKVNLPDTLLNGEVMVKESSTNRLEMLDTKWSAAQGRNAITITTGLHVDYHRPTDDAQFINYSGILASSELVQKLISNIQP